MIERLLAGDTDGDDRLTREEFPERMRQRFERMDANGDGYVEPSEIEAMMRRGFMRGGPRGGPGPWMRRDTDGDGRLSQEELPPRMRQRFEEFDTDEDGFLDQQELAAMRPRMGGRRGSGSGRPGGGGPEGEDPGSGDPEGGDRLATMMRADANQDGKLSREEAPPPLSKRFDELDADGDGFLSADEIRAAR